MGVFRIEKNTKVVIEGSIWRFRKKIGPSLWQLEEESTGRFLEKEQTDLLVMHFEGQLRAVLDHPVQKGKTFGRELEEAEKDQIRWRLRFVKAVEDSPVEKSLYQLKIDEEWEKCEKEWMQNSKSASAEVGGPSMRRRDAAPYWSTVYRWVIRYRGAGYDAYALLKKDRKDSDRCDSEVIEAIDESLDEYYLTRERAPLQAAIDSAKLKVNRLNAKREVLGLPPFTLPSRRRVERRLALLPAFDVYAARYGRSAAITKFRSVSGHRTTSRFLERVEIDHTPLDLFVVDDESGLPLGRPYITMCIDDLTRCILGLYVGFIPPSYQSVALCLKHALVPKVHLQRDYPEVKNPWVAYGVMRTLVTDQASEFHSEALELACNSLGISIEYAPRKQGWYKAKIERVLRRLNEEVAHGTEGTTFRNTFEKGDYNPEEFAVVRMSTLRLGLHIWVCDVYHEKPHHALNMSPAMMWKLSTRSEDIPLPQDRNVLDLHMGRPYSRLLSHKGIEFEGLHYGGDAVHDLRIRYGPKLQVEIKVNESDLGQVHVIYRDEVVIAKALESDYAQGLSLWLHKKIQAHSPRYDSDSWMEALERLRTLLKGERAVLRKLPRRGKGRTIEGLPAPAVQRSLPQPQLPDGAGASSIHKDDLLFFAEPIRSSRCVAIEMPEVGLPDLLNQ